jgi:hypothetical protein
VIYPSPAVLDRLIRDRHDQVRRMARHPQRPDRTGLRVRIGLALIAAGSSLSGERVEMPARRRAVSRTA